MQISSDAITRDNFIRKEVCLFAVTDDVTVVGNELVECLTGK